MIRRHPWRTLTAVSVLILPLLPAAMFMAHLEVERLTAWWGRR